MNIGVGGNNYKSIWLHVLFSIPCLFFYFGSIEWIKLLLLLYPIGLILSRDATYLPAILIHTIAGSSVSTILLVVCFIVSVRSRLILMKARIWKTFVLYSIPLPFAIGLFIYRKLILGLALYDCWAGIHYYLGLFPFFFGFVIFPSFNRKIINALIIIFASVIILDFLKLFDYKFRLLFLVYPLFVTIFIAIVFKLIRFRFNVVLIIFIFLSFLIFLTELNSASFTLLLSIMFTIFFTFGSRTSSSADSYYNAYNADWSFLKFAFPISLIAIFFVINSNLSNSIVVIDTDVLQEDWDLTNFSQLGERIIVKIFSDRLPLWQSVYKNLFMTKNMMLWPPLVLEQSYTVENRFGSDLEITYGAHNLFLELCRTDGILLGVFIFSFFSYFLILGSKYLSLFIVKTDYNKVLFRVILISFITAAFFGTLFGQYPLMIGVSFPLFVISGMGFAYFKSVKFQ